MLKRLSAVLLLVIILLTILYLSQNDHKGSLHIVFLDAGQGDCIFIRTPSGKTVLIDGGGGRDLDSGIAMGTQVFMPFLRREAVNKVDLVILTHPHDDHIQGLIPILSGMTIGTVIEPSLPFTSKSYREFLDVIEKKHVTYKRAIRGQVIDFSDGVTMQVLNPSQTPLSGTSDDINSNSVVIRLLYKDKAYLFMGDAGIDTLSDFQASGIDYRCNVIKVGHHGSRTSLNESFLQKCGADTAIISAGKNNPFGHPSPDILQLLSRNTVNVYCTNSNGAIEINY